MRNLLLVHVATLALVTAPVYAQAPASVRASPRGIITARADGIEAGPAQSTAAPTRSREPTDDPKKKQASRKTDDSPEEPDDTTEAAPTYKHPSFKLGQHVTIAFTARVEGDMRAPLADIGLPDTEYHWQDRRIGVRGDLFKRIHFEIERELSQDFYSTIGLNEISEWRDLYVDVQVVKHVNVRGGRFKLPLGHEALASESDLDFVLRSLPTRVLTPGRDVGVMVHGRLFKRVLEYEAGYFGRDGAHARTDQTEGGRDAAVARLVVAPLAQGGPRGLASLRIGAAAALSRVDDRFGVRGRTAFGDGIFFDRVYVNGERTRVGWELSWTGGPVGFAAERITMSEQRTGMDFHGGDLPAVDTSGWYAAATIAVTGEAKRRGRLSPRRPFLQGGAGAFEIAARIEELRFGTAPYPTTGIGYPGPDTLAANGERAATLGVNWYINNYFKVQADLVRESIDDPQRSPAPSAGGHFTSYVVRVQFRL